MSASAMRFVGLAYDNLVGRCSGRASITPAGTVALARDKAEQFSIRPLPAFPCKETETVNAGERSYQWYMHACSGCDKHVPTAHGVVRETERPTMTLDVYYCEECWYIADHADPVTGSFGAAATELVRADR